MDKISQSILAKAFRGELVISEAELAAKEGRDFESAEKLLARILEEKEKMKGDLKGKDITTKSKKRKMKTDSRKISLIEIIQSNKNGISPENLFMESGLQINEIDKFYSELKTISDEIEEVRDKENIDQWPEKESIVLKAKK